MKRAYKIIGIDCADCTAKLEARLAKIDGVKNISISFITQKCNIEVEDDRADEIIQEVMELISKTEPDAEVKRI